MEREILLLDQSDVYQIRVAHKKLTEIELLVEETLEQLRL